MCRVFFLLLIFTNLVACKQIQSRQIAELNCTNPVSDEQMNVVLCLPNNNFEIEKSKNHFAIYQKRNDSTDMSGVFFMVKVDDFKEKLSSTWYRDEQLKQYQASPEIDLEILSKGNQIIDGKEFANLEMIISMSDKKVYSRTLFYFEGTVGYLLDANGLIDKLNDGTKSDILSLFKTFRISGPPNY
jgi:hypothetical protein